MAGPAVLIGGAGVFGVGIAMLVAALLPARSGQHGVARALTTIERSYTRAPAAAGTGADLPGALPVLGRAVALRLSPATIAGSLRHRLDVAGNPRRWTPDRMLAAKGLGLLAGAVL